MVQIEIHIIEFVELRPWVHMSPLAVDQDPTTDGTASSELDASDV